MKQLVKELITQPEIDKIADLLTQAIAVATPPAIPLDMADRQKRRKMGTARQGYVNMVLPVAINNIGLLRRDQEPAYLGKLMDTFTKIATMRGLAQKMLELADDTWDGHRYRCRSAGRFYGELPAGCAQEQRFAGH